MIAARIFVVGGVLSYRALFNWMQPVIYVPTMLGGPLFQILFFAYIGRASGVESDAFFVVGNAVQVSAMAGIFGVAMTIGGERWTQTLSLGMLGIVMAATLILYRYAFALANMLEYPIWLAAGLLAPIALLPDWVHPISYALAPTWGAKAVRESVLGGAPLTAIGMCLGLAAVYLVVGFFFVQNFERLARQRATLALS